MDKDEQDFLEWYRQNSDKVPFPETAKFAWVAAKQHERESCANALDAIATEGSFDPEGLRVLRDAISSIRAGKHA